MTFSDECTASYPMAPEAIIEAAKVFHEEERIAYDDLVIPGWEEAGYEDQFSALAMALEMLSVATDFELPEILEGLIHELMWYAELPE